jgi:major membrane immunogen (membrane-anchored lipoprotein)
VHFKDNPVYIKQCRKDSKGVRAYPKKLFKTQDIDQVDAMSGATWSYNIFKASVNEALKNAYNEFETTPSH